jgi:hypothetical protein
MGRLVTRDTRMGVLNPFPLLITSYSFVFLLCQIVKHHPVLRKSCAQLCQIGKRWVKIDSHLGLLTKD